MANNLDTKFITFDLLSFKSEIELEAFLNFDKDSVIVKCVNGHCIDFECIIEWYNLKLAICPCTLTIFSESVTKPEYKSNKKS